MTWRTEQDRAFYVYDNGTGDFVANARDEETARLIAALPDLLTALEKSRAWVAQYQMTPGHDAAARSMLRVIDDAVERATGEES